ncbi:MAG TPA: LytTR family DNA-binding domain-containing protein [Pyrinomonadaceae bacterium]|nr:LytTR family DNA-binding domain-containing protein [Pyrinomonadaceae bacterium]
MTKLKALIVDDERLARRELRSLLADFSEVEIVGEADSVNQALDLIENKQPTIVFLDIQLTNETGFDLLERVESAEFKTIFVTAFDAYAIRAFEVNALDYLLKPVNPERLKKAIEKIVKDEKSAENNLRKLAFDDRLFLEMSGRSIFLKINRISHILAAGDYSEVFTIEGKKFLVEKPLREWETRLPEKHFIRIHRTSINNLECVERLESWFNRSYQIYLQNNREPLTVSRRYAAQLKQKFG